jgi:hypothetical protein
MFMFTLPVVNQYDTQEYKSLDIDCISYILKSIRPRFRCLLRCWFNLEYCFRINIARIILYNKSKNS